MMASGIIILEENRNISRILCGKLQGSGYAVEVHTVTGGNIEMAVAKVAKILNYRQLILVFRNENLKIVTKIFHEYGIADLSVFPYDTHLLDNKSIKLEDCIIPIDNTKPRLSYVEVEVSECCNLNCKGCSEFSNLVENNKFCDLTIFRKDLEKLKELFWGIGKIRLLGGEPLMNPDFLKFVIVAREVFPDSDIRLVSNGLLIPKITKQDFAGLKSNNCSFDISNYRPTHKIIGNITDCLKEAEIPYHIGMPVRIFFKSLLSEPTKSPTKAYNNCLFSYCHALGRGYLAACSVQLSVYRLNEKFMLNYPVDGNLDIYHTSLTGWEINETFEKPHNFCRYCGGGGMVPFKWKTCPKSKAKASDWIISPSFINVKVIPVMQGIIKSAAKQLRNIMQKPKINHIK